MYWQVDPSCYATFVSPLSRLWLETSKFKLSWFLRSIRQPNQSDHDWVEEIDYQSPSQWDLTLIYPDSTLSLTILAWLIVSLSVWVNFHLPIFFYSSSKCVTFLYIKVAGTVLFSWSEFGISHSTCFCIPLSDILQSTTCNFFAVAHFYCLVFVCCEHRHSKQIYIYETCGCEPLTVIFQSSEISNFVDLGEK